MHTLYIEYIFHGNLRCAAPYTLVIEGVEKVCTKKVHNRSFPNFNEPTRPEGHTHILTE